MCGYGVLVGKVRIFIRINIRILPPRRSVHPHLRTPAFYPWPEQYIMSYEQRTVIYMPQSLVVDSVHSLIFSTFRTLTVGCIRKTQTGGQIFKMLNKRITNSSSRCQYTQFAHCISYSEHVDSIFSNIDSLRYYRQNSAFASHEISTLQHGLQCLNSYNPL